MSVTNNNRQLSEQHYNDMVAAFNAQMMQEFGQVVPPVPAPGILP